MPRIEFRVQAAQILCAALHALVGNSCGLAQDAIFLQRGSRLRHHQQRRPLAVQPRDLKIAGILAAVKANNGEHYRYPFALRLIK